MSETEFLIGRSGLNLQDDFYPDDLPNEWRFDYYSTMFKALSLPIDGDEDLDLIFEELEESDEEFELILSIDQAQLLDIDTLRSLLDSVADYKDQFILFCELDKTPNSEVMALLKPYQISLQSPGKLSLDLKHKQVSTKFLYFTHLPVLYVSSAWSEKEMRAYIEQVASINTKTILICKYAESETLNKMRIITEILGY